MLDRRDVDQVNSGWGDKAQAAPDPVAAEAASRAFRFLQELASDLSTGTISFPTFIDATVKIRDALNHPNVDASRLAEVPGRSEYGNTCRCVSGEAGR